MTKPTLVFVSPRFLFPADSGGKIRTTQILRGLKGGAFHVLLLGPASVAQREEFSGLLAEVADEVSFWPAPHAFGGKLLRLRHLVGRLPVPVASDRSPTGARAVERALAGRPAVAVFDFVHSAVLLPQRRDVPTVMFTHNVEAEIFARHAKVANGPVRRAIWRQQYRKMLTFESESLSKFDAVVAVSERDKAQFAAQYGLDRVYTIPTGVDSDHLAYAPPGDDQRVVFCGSMDWLPNVDGVEYFLTQVWPSVTARVPRATMTIVGRSPPKWLVAKASAMAGVSFTGYVDDIRPHTSGAAAFVIPLRVGGGTRIKAFEATALGCPVVSTSIGVEGLPLTPGEHYLRADSASEMADAVVSLLTQRELRDRISRAARSLTEANFSYRVAARVFEDICLDAAHLSRDAARRGERT